MKAFVDTNILIDYICKREPFFIPAKSVFAACYMKKVFENRGYYNEIIKDAIKNAERV